tara:strand:+ start:100 stop:348 length:249 start_codon:yes stop_codon:yes gene_type:complete
MAVPDIHSEYNGWWFEHRRWPYPDSSTTGPIEGVTWDEIRKMTDDGLLAEAAKGRATKDLGNFTYAPGPYNDFYTPKGRSDD